MAKASLHTSSSWMSSCHGANKFSIGFQRVATHSEISLAPDRIAMLAGRRGQGNAHRKRGYHEPPHCRPALSPERRYLTRAAAARIKTMMTSNQTSPMPHIIPDVMPSIMIAHRPWLASGQEACAGTSMKVSTRPSRFCCRSAQVLCWTGRRESRSRTG